jgi:hypothetical protein
MYCTCEGSPEEHFVYGTNGTDACELLLDACVGVVPFGSEFHCQDPTTALDETSCSNVRECGLRTELDAGAGVHALSELVEVSSGCDRTGVTGMASCYCVGFGTGSLVAQVEGSVDVELCGVADEVCMTVESLPSFGPVECPDGAFPSVEGESCTAGNSSCTQAASFGTYAASVTGPLAVDCAPGASTGEWSCQCRSGDYLSDAFVWTSESAASACGESFTRCATLATGSERRGYGAVDFRFE